jgi:hypothetical protein
MCVLLMLQSYKKMPTVANGTRAATMSRQPEVIDGVVS